MAEAAVECGRVNCGKVVPGRKIDFGEQAALLEHRAVGEDHDRWLFGVWSRDFSDFTAAL